MLLVPIFSIIDDDSQLQALVKEFKEAANNLLELLDVSSPAVAQLKVNV